MEEFSFEVIQSENENIMDDEELYFIAKTMYEKFKSYNIESLNHFFYN